MPQLPSGITRQQVLAQLSTEYVLPVSTVETKWKECIEKAPVTRMSEWLSEVSHPQSKKYGQHWSAKEVAEAFAPR